MKELLDMASEKAGFDEAVDAMFPSDKAKGKAKRNDEPGDDVGSADHRDKKTKKREDKRVTLIVATEPRLTHPRVGRSKASVKM